MVNYWILLPSSSPSSHCSCWVVHSSDSAWTLAWRHYGISSLQPYGHLQRNECAPPTPRQRGDGLQGRCRWPERSWSYSPVASHGAPPCLPESAMRTMRLKIIALLPSKQHQYWFNSFFLKIIFNLFLDRLASDFLSSTLFNYEMI